MNRQCRLVRLLLLSFLIPCTAARADASEETKAPAVTTEVEIIKDVAYYEGKDADPLKHKLDLFLPKGHKNFPVLFFVHGGAWVHGDKDGLLGFYQSMAKFWAGRGVAMVVANYRLSPKVTHPEHIKDVAKAFAWTHQNIGKYGGSADNIFVCGHSAGGHLVALLATDDSYLRAHGLNLAAIRGAISMSGVYRIPEKEAWFDLMFAADAKLRHDASPITHARDDAPPFLIIYAEKDYRYCGKDPSEEFCQAIKDKKGAAQTLEVHKRGHVTLIANSTRDDDPVALALRKFMEEHAK